MATRDVSQPFFRFNGENQTALVASVTLIFASLSGLSIVAKLAVRRGIFSLHLFDYILFFGAALLFVQTGLVISATSSGLGLHADASGVDKERVRKLQYAATILAIAATGCTKFSMCLLIRMINNYGRISLAIRLLLVLLSVFPLTSILATALQCSMPSPWLASSPEACPAVRSIYLYSNIANAVTDLLLFALAVAMVWNVHTDSKKKTMVITLFGIRIICPIVTCLALGNTQHLYNGTDDDFTWLSVWPTVYLQCSYNLSIITVCVPSLKVVIDSFYDNGRHVVLDKPYHLTAVSRSHKARDQDTTSSSLVPNPSAYKFTAVSRRRNREDDDDGQSESVRNLTEGIIHIQEEVEVQFDSPKTPPRARHP